MTCRRRPVTQSLSGILILALSGIGWGGETVLRTAVKSVSINFATSGLPSAQKIFLEGVMLLHNFQYDDALLKFKDAIKIQPDFSMAYWGLAMSYNHPLWGEQDLESAKNALEALDKISSPRLSVREQSLISAIKLLYGDGDKATRDTRYASAMHQLYSEFPEDDEIAGFYGLALLGTKAESQDFTVNVKASDVLERVCERSPNHPGILHYLVHCYDDPKYASLGLQAANRYGRVAPESAHALHMPSHIYLNLGMWTEYMRANEASWHASLSRVRSMHSESAVYDIHALHTLLWLEYGYLQKGQATQAAGTLKTMANIYISSPDPMVKWYLAMMRATYIVNASDWQDINMLPHFRDIESLDLRDVEFSASASNLFATGLLAVRQKRPDELRRVIGEIGASIKSTQDLLQSTALHGDKAHNHGSFFTGVYASSIKPAEVMKAQLEAMELLANGKLEDAFDLLQYAVGVEDKLSAGYGPPVPVKPSAELLGEVYLLARHNQSAMRAFQIAVLRYPNRAVSLVGLSKAARHAGDRQTALKAEAKLSAFQGRNSQRPKSEGNPHDE